MGVESEQGGEEGEGEKNSAHHSPIHDGEDLSHPYKQSTTVLCDIKACV